LKKKIGANNAATISEKIPSLLIKVYNSNSTEKIKSSLFSISPHKGMIHSIKISKTQNKAKKVG